MLRLARALTSGLRFVALALACCCSLVTAARAAPSSACGATLEPGGSTLRLHLPFLAYKGQGLQADLDYVPSSDGEIWLRVASYAVLDDTTAYAACPQAYLSTGFVLDIPEVAYGSAAYTASLQYVPGGLGTDDSVLMFKVMSLNAIDYVRASRAWTSGLTVAAGRSLVVSNAGSPAATTLDVQGDFVCEGEIDIWDAPTSLRINVSGNATLACNLRFLRTAAANTLTVVAGGSVRIQPGFVLPASGHVIVTDSASLLQTTSALLADATSDDGATPSIMPGPDATAATARQATLRRPRPLDGAGCDSSHQHVITGRLAPPAHRQVLPPNEDPGPVVLAAWLQCDVAVRDVDIVPPSWDTPPPQNRGDKNGAKGRKGLTLNLRSEGKITFGGTSRLRLMDGDDGQASVVTGDPAVATAGDGGESGDMKIAAPGGISFDDNATLTIVPGRSGHGGFALAFGTAGVDGCPGTKGGDATATGGKGADAKKTLRARGFDPTGKVFVDEIAAGHGGAANALAGPGGHGTPGKCNGGAGGAATSTAGKGGSASFRYSGPGSVGAPATLGGNGGDATSESGRGGNGGNQAARCDVGGNGAKGGNSVARAGQLGTGSAPGTDGSASAGGGSGDGGLCGNYNSSNGAAGTWTEYLGATQTASGAFTPGQRDCSCSLTSPRIALSTSALSFAHHVGQTSCPQTIGTVNVTNAGDGNFRFSVGTLPPWLSASPSSGNAGSAVTFRFTCVGWSPAMSTTARITGTNLENNQPLAQDAAVTITGTAQ